jgi:hypothetical protein
MSYHHYNPEVYRRLAATGKYYNTGRVLIGLMKKNPVQYPTLSEEIIQGALLGVRHQSMYPRWTRKILTWTVLSLFLLLLALSAL